MLIVQQVLREWNFNISSSKLFLQNMELSNLESFASKFGFTSNTQTNGLTSISLLPELVKSRTFAKNLLVRQFYTEKYNKKLHVNIFGETLSAIFCD